MKKRLNWSAVVSITNKKRTLFYLQQKDETYWIPRHRLRYCFFGGGIEKGEKELTALKRELSEEFDEENALTILQNSKKLFDVYFTNVEKKPWKISLYESVLEEESLNKLTHTQVKEGKGVLIGLENLLKIPFFLDLKKPVLGQYIQYLNYLDS